MTKFTVLGAGGFIGSHLAASLEQQGVTVDAPVLRGADGVLGAVLQRDLGHVFYCIGLTANFRERPCDTVEAHVCLLKRVLEQGRFASLTYLSSTRVYEGAATTAESAVLQVAPGNPGHLYNLSKLMGESLCLASGRRARVVRLSNVYGPAMPAQNFISSVLAEAASTGHVRFLTAENSAKDYVAVSDVVRWLPQIALQGAHPIYNVASGTNLSNAGIASLLQRQGVTASFAEDAPAWSFPVIDTSRLVQEFGAPQHGLADEFGQLFEGYSGHGYSNRENEVEDE